MKNKEKYAKDIAESAIKDDYYFAYDKTLKRIASCCGTRCNNCLFYDGKKSCKINRLNWANAEYKEKKEFSETDKAYVKAMDKLNWFARDKNGIAYGYVHKPFKNGGVWDVKAEVGDEYAVENVSSYSSATFEPLSWDDEEPTHRSEILGEEWNEQR